MKPSETTDALFLLLQQILPALLASDSDAESLQVLLHLLGALFHRVLRKELSDIGFKLRSYQTDDSFAHARDRVIGILL